MARQTLEKGSKVVYYAEGQPYKGPFPAVVETVHPVEKDKKAEPPRLDLNVFFGDIEGPSHRKTNVPHSLEPMKHHWGPIPDAWVWPEPAEKPAEAPSDS